MSLAKLFSLMVAGEFGRAMLNIVLVGAGKLGSRHLQALSQVKIKDINIHVVDLNTSALSTAKDRFKEMPKNPNILNINYLSNIF